MFRIFYANVNYNPSYIGNNINLQIVRWRRKPRWEPTAKSKVFRVPQRKDQPTNEKAELMFLHNNYRTQINSIRSYLHEELKSPTTKSIIDDNSLEVAKNQYLDQNCVEKNNNWNKKISLLREARLMDQKKIKVDFINNRLELAKLKEELNESYGTEVLRLQKRDAESYIPQSEIQERIENALENLENKSFSINLKGDILKD